MSITLSDTRTEQTPVDRLRVDTYTRGILGPSQPMLGPLADGGTS
jgi:formamidase